MSSWEKRMATRAAERARFVAAEERATDPHAAHHSHLEGATTYCSCGKFTGITSVVITADYDPDKLSCAVCGQRGVVNLG
jgi:hypothetical protein